MLLHVDCECVILILDGIITAYEEHCHIVVLYNVVSVIMCKVLYERSPNWFQSYL